MQFRHAWIQNDDGFKIFVVVIKLKKKTLSDVLCKIFEFVWK